METNSLWFLENVDVTSIFCPQKLGLETTDNHIKKKFKKGERKEYFIAEKDVVTIFKAVIYQRKKTELAPMLKVLSEVSKVEGGCCESDEFCKVVNELNQFSHNADKLLTNLINTERKWIMGALMKFMR